MEEEYNDTISKRIKKLEFEEGYYRQVECKGEYPKYEDVYYARLTTELNTLKYIWNRLQKI